ncbi:MAG: glycosyltransferase family 39 protein, partial [Polyangiaceae bacterium]|nr:glycosyltransferase family 39 protein [Polyangiaceae bacterium]
MHSADPRLERTASALAFIACAWFAFAAAWGLFQLPAAGHSGAGSVGTAASSWPIVKWKILYPTDDWFSPTAPAKASYHCHHPFGAYWWSAICFFVFGHHDAVVRLPPVLLSIAIPPLIYGIGKDAWGTFAGAAGACAYAVMPIALGFANFDNLETPGIFGSLLFFWGQGRYLATGRSRDLAASVAGCAVCCSADWNGYATVAPLLGWGLLRGFVWPARFTPRVDRERYARWWALSASVAVLTMVLWVGLFFRANKVADWLASGEMRGGDGSPLKVVLEARKSWIDFSFTPFAIAIGKAAVPVILARIVLFRRDSELYALSALVGAVVEYVVFKRGADVHIFWPHQFAEYYALAIAQLAASIACVAHVARRLWPSPRAGLALQCAALALGILPSVAMAPDAARSLLVWRRTGGRYDDKGTLIRSDADLLHVMRHVIASKKTPEWTLDAGPGGGFGWEHAWAFDGSG